MTALPLLLLLVIIIVVVVAIVIVIVTTTTTIIARRAATQSAGPARWRDLPQASSIEQLGAVIIATAALVELWRGPPRAGCDRAPLARARPTISGAGARSSAEQITSADRARKDSENLGHSSQSSTHFQMRIARCGPCTTASAVR